MSSLQPRAMFDNISAGTIHLIVLEHPHRVHLLNWFCPLIISRLVVLKGGIPNRNFKTWMENVFAFKNQRKASKNTTNNEKEESV